MKTKMVAIWVAVLALTALLFQNCDKASSQKNDPVYTVNSGNVTAVHWHYSSGTVSPDYHYDVKYFVDLQSQSLTITVSKGSLATGQPLPDSRTLSAAQVEEAKRLLNSLSYTACGGGNPSVGGGLDEVSIFSFSSTTPDATIYHSSCTGMPGLKDVSGYQELTAYIKDL